MKALDIATYIEALAPQDTCIPGDEFGLVFGDPNVNITGVCVAWWATAPVIEAAASAGANVLLVHEQLFVGEQRSSWYEEAPMWAKPVNQRRMQALLDGGFTVFRYHSNWDAYPVHGVSDSFGRALGLTDEIARGAYTRTYQVEPVSLGDLTRSVREAMGIGAVRLFGDPKRTIEKVGTMIGGFGGNQFNMPEELLEQNADVVVMADMNEYTALNALEIGLAVIETLHSASEEPAMQEMARLVAERFSELDVRYLPSGVHTYGITSR
jgi:putative NIF3 family GTP cyclohydrolase 1 type 2